ncbi:unnamed protein product [Agarophyton chilense]
MHNDSVRRIMAELKELSRLNSQHQRLFHATPLESDLFEWHFSVRGPPETAFEGGVYHGRIVLPTDYPLKPPEIILLTPNGRFEVGKRICLSVTAHHQETWQPSWGIRTILTALIGFMPSPAEGLGALDYPDEDRRRLAKKSHSFKCERCGMRPIEQLPPTVGISGTSASNILGTASSAASKPASLTAGQSSNVRSSPAGSSTIPSSIGHERDVGESSADGTSIAASTISEPRTSNGKETSVDGSASSHQAATSTSNTTFASASTGHRTRETATHGDEKELLYMAYAIVALMIAVIARRVLKTMAE